MVLTPTFVKLVIGVPVLVKTTREVAVVVGVEEVVN